MPSPARLTPFAHLLLVLVALVSVAASGCGDRTDVLEELVDGSVPPADAHHHDVLRHDGPPVTCDCPEGCCNAEGACVSGTSSDACGAGGSDCTACPASETCNGAGFCQGTGGCSPATCPGCCDGTGTCQAGTSLPACGGGGEACVNCAQPGFVACDPASRACIGVMTGCSPANCPAGCCEPTTMGLECVGGSPTNCGTGGQICQQCNPGQVCDPGSGTCVTPQGCNPGNCGGCCQGDICVMGEPSGACGLGGEACVACAPGEFCSGGVCEGDEGDGGSCGPGNCAGCCGVTGTCRAGTHTRSCGSGGEQCEDCGPGGACENGLCIIMPPPFCDCPGGCCDATGNCQPGNSPGACGSNGGMCVPCNAEGTTCIEGLCRGPTMKCNPMTCPTGCCDVFGSCQTGNTVNSCGKSGSACASCPAGDACVGSVCQGSTCLESCPEGCCDESDVCQPGTTNAACGEGGQCAVCSGGGFCENGECQDSTCSAASCPTGCCDGSGACQPGNQTFECGTGGGFCNSCDPTSQCIGGNCQETGCNEETCEGCCDQDDNCQPGETATACGFGGNACNVCSGTSSCANGACEGFTCDAATCPQGCCDSNGNCQTGFGITGGAVCPCSATCQGCCDGTGACRAGTIDQACGSQGATCVNCAAMSETCDNDMFPVVCDQSCPSSFPTCPTGTTMTPPQVFADTCHPGDLTDAAAGCAGGAETADCQNFFDGEFEANPNCANCLEQFDFDFVQLTGIYTCAEPFLSAACDVSTGCANDCAGTVCESCSEDQTTCETNALTGVCAPFVTPANKCIATSAPATALCAQASYPNFGAWLQGVGNHYCGAVTLPP